MRAPQCLALAAVFALLCEVRTTHSAENDLPKKRAGEAGDAGTALFDNGASDPLFPATLLSETDTEQQQPDPPATLEKARLDYEAAQRKEKRWQKLVKSGVLAQVDAEACALQTARTRLQYEKARVADQQRALEELRQRATAGQLTPDAVGAAESALQTAQTMAAEAETSLQRTQLLLAENNLDRQRRLIAMGSGSKNQLKRAETALAALKGAGSR